MDIQRRCLGIPKNIELIPVRQFMLDETIKIERPNHWGGYEIVLDRVEFWQGRPGRVHDRALYQKAEGTWIKSRLSP
ncbi:MAG: hypothetical protein EBU80_11650 [Chitinophagia bacterium]|nr:hypothetical protein [Chitinophagia bacterium]